MERKYNFHWWRNITINMEKYNFRWWRGNITSEWIRFTSENYSPGFLNSQINATTFGNCFLDKYHSWRICDNLVENNIWSGLTEKEKNNQVTSSFFWNSPSPVPVLIGSLYSHWIGLRCEMKNEQWQVSGRELPTALCLNSVRHTLPGTEISCVKFYNLILWFIIKSSYNFYILLPKVK